MMFMASSLLMFTVALISGILGIDILVLSFKYIMSAVGCDADCALYTTYYSACGGLLQHFCQYV